MGEEKNLYEMSDYELAMILSMEPERLDEVIEMLTEIEEFDRIGKIAGFIEQDKVPEEEIGDYRHNKKIEQVLNEMYERFDVSPEYDEEYYEPTRPSRISMTMELEGAVKYGAALDTLRKKCEVNGYNLDEIFDEEELKRLYSIYGYEYDPENDSVKRINKKDREVSISEIKEVAEGQRIESKNGAINAVTSPKQEKFQEGQSHDDE